MHSMPSMRPAPFSVRLQDLLYLVFFLSIPSFLFFQILIASGFSYVCLRIDSVGWLVG